MFAVISRPKVLIVDKDPTMRTSLTAYLTGEAMAVRSAGSIGEACALMVRDPPDIVILDLALPDGNGLDLIGASGEWSGRPAYIVVSSRNDEIDRVLSLELGADDHISKPFSYREILARVRALNRRLRARIPSGTEILPALPFQQHELHIDPDARKVRVAGKKDLPLTNAEFLVLSLLHVHAGKTLTREFLAREVFGRTWRPDDRSIDQIVATLRRKIRDHSPDWDKLHTVRGSGYVLVR
jgi:DNA-binding response OmpR family regulator